MTISSFRRKAKIVCTIGPASNTYETIKELALVGLDVARLNFSHGAHEDHLKVIEIIRQVSKDLQKPIAILQDLQGPKIRTGKLADGQIPLEAGQKYIITTEDIIGDEKQVSTTFKDLAKEVKTDDLLLIDDGNLHLKVLSTDNTRVKCEVIVGGILKNSKGINLPHLKLNTPALTEKDIEDLKFGLAQEVDYVALSFVREAGDVDHLRNLIKQYQPANNTNDTPIISKIEKPQAVENIDEIIAASDGIMVARGDLGIELQIDRVPVVQKQIIQKANAMGKVVITATQMLESMIQNPIPTRAEASDVANAIFDGTDAVMLSGETASGKYPIETVSTMSRIIDEAENSPIYSQIIHRRRMYRSLHNVLGAENPQEPLDQDIPEYANPFQQIISDLACHAANDIEAKAVVVITASGNIAKRISKGRPSSHIIALSPDQGVRNRMSLYWGVRSEPITDDMLHSINRAEDLTRTVEHDLKAKGILIDGDKVVITSGTKIPNMGSTNILKLHQLGGPQ